MSRLVHNTRGNVLAIVGAAILPLLCMIGSGIDVSRYYMAEARLQQACDAASLAGRRAMTAGVVDDAVRAEALKFFNFNFTQGSFSTATFTPAVSGAANQTVVVTASTTIPTTIMKIFGFSTLNLAVTCNAKQDFVNTDIVLVLDSTGSMLCATTESSCSNTSEKTSSKIKGLRSAVLALYDQLAPVQTQLEAAGLRLRYGVVPYSSGMNVGAIVRGMNTDYIVHDEWDYMSRVANYSTLHYQVITTTEVTTETYPSSISSANCVKYGANQSFSGFSPSPSGNPTTTGTPPADVITITYSAKDWGGSTTISGTGNKTCRRNASKTTKDYVPRYSFTNWSYQPTTYDVSKFGIGTAETLLSNTGGTVASAGAYNVEQLATAAENVATVNPTTYIADTVTAPTTTTSTWDGCIEERDTVSNITASSGYSIPSGAHDLNIDEIPSSNETRWRPYWSDIEWRQDSSAGNALKPQIACPAAARRLQAWTRSDLSGYLDTLVATGGTYHDNGMIWGARLLSQGGIFSSDNPSTYGGMPVSRFVIFMTDGLLDTGSTLYSTYGMEYWDKRTISGTYSDSANDATHNQRFKMMCNATKSMGVSIWVVAFASALDSTLTECASNANQASTSADTNSLVARFTEIGRNIGALRLTQ